MDDDPRSTGPCITLCRPMHAIHHTLQAHACHASPPCTLQAHACTLYIHTRAVNHAYTPYTTQFMACG